MCGKRQIGEPSVHVVCGVGIGVCACVCVYHWEIAAVTQWCNFSSDGSINTEPSDHSHTARGVCVSVCVCVRLRTVHVCVADDLISAW